MADSTHPDSNSFSRTTANARFDRLFQGRIKPPQLQQGERRLADQELRIRQKTRQSPETTNLHPRPRDDADCTKPQVISKSVNTATEDNPLDVHSQSTSTTAQIPPSIEFLPYGKLHADSTHAALNNEELDLWHTEPIADLDAEVCGKYCLFPQLIKFPYKYMIDSEDGVSKHFFARDQIYERGLSLYCLSPPSRITDTPLLLIPYDEVKSLTEEITKKFNVAVKVPPFPFTLTFYGDSTPQPTFLGKVERRADVADLVHMVSETSRDHGECPPGADEKTQRNFAAFHEKVQRALDINKKRGASVKRKKAKRRTAAVIDSINQLNRAQRYLGLRPRMLTPGIPPLDSPFDQHRSYEQAEMKRCAMILDPLNTRSPAPFEFEGLPVMISIDVESWEENHNLITEVGISTLDTKDLLDLAPGTAGCEWVSKIRSRHFRIKNHEHLVNHKFCQGNPTCFRYGRSEFVTVNEAPDVVDSCFEQPFSADFECSQVLELDEWGTSVHSARTPQRDEKLPSTGCPAKKQDTDSDRNQSPPTRRNILLVGHDLQGDLDSLSILGSTIFGSHSTSYVHNRDHSHISERRTAILTSILEALDTAVLYKHYIKASQTRNLASMCVDLGITPWFAHNAGNDARYTLECLIKLAIGARQEEDEAVAQANTSKPLGMMHALQELEKQKRTDQTVEIARQRIEGELRSCGIAGATDAGFSMETTRQPENLIRENTAPNDDGEAATLTYEHTRKAIGGENAKQNVGYTDKEIESKFSSEKVNDGDASEAEDWYPY